MYKTKILHRFILQKYWVLFFGGLKGTFSINYMFFNALYSEHCFYDMVSLVRSIQKSMPLLFSLKKTKVDLLFIGTRFLYSKTTTSTLFLVSQLTNRNPGIFSNFSITSFYSMHNLALKKPPQIIFFLYLQGNDTLVREAKIKHIPVIALVNSNDNSTLIDYPLMVGSSYFYTVYFFSLFYLRFLRFN
jgi:ribosomal protein S2